MRQSSCRGQFLVAFSKILGWRPERKGIVGADVVVDVLPLPHRLVELLQIQLPHIAVVELFRMGPLSSLHMPVQLGRTRRKDE